MFVCRTGIWGHRLHGAGVTVSTGRRSSTVPGRCCVFAYAGRETYGQNTGKNDPLHIAQDTLYCLFLWCQVISLINWFFLWNFLSSCT